MYGRLRTGAEHTAYVGFVAANVLVGALVAAAVTWALSHANAVAHIGAQFGRGGPAGAALMVVSLSAAWIDLLVVPTLQLRATLRPGAIRRGA